MLTDWEVRGKVSSVRGEKPRWQAWASVQAKLVWMPLARSCSRSN